MSLMNDRDIQLALETGELVITPQWSYDIQPASIDLQLGPNIRTLGVRDWCYADDIHIDPENSESLLSLDRMSTHIFLRDEPFILLRNAFILGHTRQTITLPPNIAARVEGVSTLGRIGLLTHSTAGWIDPGFSGQITLELKNVGPFPIKLTSGMRICQLAFFRMDTPSMHPYGSKSLGSRYQGQTGVTTAKGK